MSIPDINDIDSLDADTFTKAIETGSILLFGSMKGINIWQAWTGAILVEDMNTGTVVEINFKP
jgi:hypothetical protein